MYLEERVRSTKSVTAQQSLKVILCKAKRHPMFITSLTCCNTVNPSSGFPRCPVCVCVRECILLYRNIAISVVTRNPRICDSSCGCALSGGECNLILGEAEVSPPSSDSWAALPFPLSGFLSANGPLRQRSASPHLFITAFIFIPGRCNSSICLHPWGLVTRPKPPFPASLTACEGIHLITISSTQLAD